MSRTTFASAKPFSEPTVISTAYATETDFTTNWGSDSLEKPLFDPELPLSSVDNFTIKVYGVETGILLGEFIPKYGELPLIQSSDCLQRDRSKAMDKALDSVDLFSTFPRINLLSSRLVSSEVHYNGNHSSDKISG